MSRFGVSCSVISPAMLLMLMLGASLMMTCTKANQRTAAEHGVVKNPTLDHGDTLIKIAPGRNISLPCAGTGAIRWFFRRFDGDSDDQLLEEQAEPTPLVRQAMTYDDSGSYECRQEARPTVAISSYTVLVLATPNKKEQLYGEIVPESSQFVEHGATVALACVLYNTDLYDSTMITWSLQPYVDQGTTNVTSWAVAVDRRTSLLVIRNATWRHRGSYHCQLPVGLHDVDFRAITVGERPTPPVDVACVLDNSQYVTCSWLPGNEPRISTAHALRYRQSKTEAWQEAVAAAQSQCECSDTNSPAKDGHCCQIGERFQQRIPGEYLAIGPQMQLQVEVTISNKLGRTAVTTSLSLDDTILRLPPPPFFVARPLNSSCLDVTVGYDSNAATSIWDLLDFDVECDIQYRREGRESNKPSKHATKIGLINADNQDKKQMVICGLAAYTNYTLYARCRPEHSHFQSSSSGPISANTTSAAPLSGPPMTNGAFSLKSLDGGDRLVHLYWQSPQQGDVRGKFTGYKLKKLISGHVIGKPGSADDDIIVNTTSLEVTLRADEQMQLDIWVVNDAGESRVSSRATVPSSQQLLQGPSYLSSSHIGSCAEGDVQLTWELQATSPATSVTMYWCACNIVPCRGECVGELQWTHVPHGAAARSYLLKDIANHCVAKVGISLQDGNRTSGIYWATEAYLETTFLASVAAVGQVPDWIYIAIAIGVCLFLGIASVIWKRKFIKQRWCKFAELEGIIILPNVDQTIKDPLAYDQNGKRPLSVELSMSVDPDSYTIISYLHVDGMGREQKQSISSTDSGFASPTERCRNSVGFGDATAPIGKCRKYQRQSTTTTPDVGEDVDSGKDLLRDDARDSGVCSAPACDFNANENPYSVIAEERRHVGVAQPKPARDGHPFRSLFRNAKEKKAVATLAQPPKVPMICNATYRPCGPPQAQPARTDNMADQAPVQREQQATRAGNVRAGDGNADDTPAKSADGAAMCHYTLLAFAEADDEDNGDELASAKRATTRGDDTLADGRAADDNAPIDGSRNMLLAARHVPLGRMNSAGYIVTSSPPTSRPTSPRAAPKHCACADDTLNSSTLYIDDDDDVLMTTPCAMLAPQLTPGGQRCQVDDGYRMTSQPSNLPGTLEFCRSYEEGYSRMGMAEDSNKANYFAV